MVDWVPQVYQGWKTKSALQRKGIGFMHRVKRNYQKIKIPVFIQITNTAVSFVTRSVTKQSIVPPY